MSSRTRPVLRTSLSRLAVAGAATLASVISIVPAAVAADEPTASEPSKVAEPADEPAPPKVDEPAVEVPAPQEAPAEEPATDQPTPEDTPGAVPAQEAGPATGAPTGGRAAAAAEVVYGPQTFRIGVKIAEGGYLPEGTTAEGSQFQVTFTDQNGNPDFTSCIATGEPDADGVVFCATDLAAPAGATITIAQVYAPAGLRSDPKTVVLQPCEANGAEFCAATDVVFTDTGVPPSASNDTAETAVDTPKVIDVLGNDDSADPETTLEVTGAPSNGSAVVFVEDGRPKIRYTPDAGFNGRDSFRYTLTNANGTAEAGVNLEVGDVAPIYGTQKYRVGVRLADGSYVPPGTTTAGSTFTITTKHAGGSTDSFTCTTAPVGPSESSCNPDFFGFYTADPGDTVTVVQDTAAPGLVKSTETLTLPPCEEDDCDSGLGVFLTFENTGPLPVARDDSATTDEGDEVTIDVLANDDSSDPATSLRIDSQPDDGKAEVVGRSSTPPVVPPASEARVVPSAGTLAIEYTPEKGFSGVDTFDYALTNGNGTSLATVTVDVVDGKVVDSKDAGVADDEASDDQVLPDTGGADVRLLGLAGLLFAMGGWLTSRGRRRHSVHSH